MNGKIWLDWMLSSDNWTTLDFHFSIVLKKAIHPSSNWQIVPLLCFFIRAGGFLVLFFCLRGFAEDFLTKKVEKWGQTDAPHFLAESAEEKPPKYFVRAPTTYKMEL